MNLQEFDALTIGDSVRNDRGELAEIIDTGAYGHKIMWKGTSVPFTLYRAGRMWVTMDAVSAPKQPRCPHGDTACTSPERCKHGDDNFQCLGGDYSAIAAGT